MSVGVAPGPDGLLRCPWAMSAPEYLAYHDDEWGKPVTSVQGIYERMTLEAFQSGLSWITILRKRENFRRAFAEFRPEGVSAFTEDDVARLLSDPGIVRNRAKITAAIANARLVVDLGPQFAEIVLGYRVIVLKGRPSSIHETIEIDLPNPRTRDTLRLPRFAELRERVWNTLMREARAAEFELQN